MKRQQKNALGLDWLKKARPEFGAMVAQAEPQPCSSTAAAFIVATTTTTTSAPAAHAIYMSGNSTNPQWDIGRAVLLMQKGETISDEDKVHYLVEPFLPPENYDWPSFVRVRKGISKTHVVGRMNFVNENGNMMSFSPVLRGVFCRACVFFAANDGQKAKQFVTAPFTNFRHFNDDKKKGKPMHESRQAHHDAVAKMNAFLESIRRPLAQQPPTQIYWAIPPPATTERQLNYQHI